MSVYSPHFISSTSVSSLAAVNSCFVLKYFRSVSSCSFYSGLGHHLFPSQQYLPKISLSIRSVKVPFAIYVRGVQILKVVNVNVEGGRKDLKV